MKKKIIIAGGTGYLGNVLVNHLTNYEFVILTRHTLPNTSNTTYHHWNAKTLGQWTNQLEGALAVINLTGKSVDCRYTKKNKEEITASRVNSTNILNQAILNCKNPPEHFINSSTATIYTGSYTNAHTEKDLITGNDFSVSVAKQWEKAFFNTPTPKTLKTALRTGFVLGTSGGAFPTLKKLSNYGLGGTLGPGNQIISWIHEYDFAKAVAFILNKKLTGVINIVSSNPVTNAHFMQSIQRQFKNRIAIPTPSALLKIATFIIGTEPELVLKSRYVYPQVLADNHFTFNYPTIETALQNL